MSKRSRTAPTPRPAGEVGPRQPCPCGSGKRYKACHGAAGGAATPFVARPFEGADYECDLIALRELVPAATAPLPVTGHPDRTVTLCTLGPGAVPAVVRDDGEIMLGLQVQHGFGDPARDLGAVLERALQADAGQVGLTQDPGAGPRIQDLVDNEPLRITVHEGFGYWFDDPEERTPQVEEMLERLADQAHPTARLTEVEAAYWTDVRTKEHLRWVMPHPEDALLDALARLHASGDDQLVDGARLVGMFRAHGVLTPVWDLPSGTGPEALESPAAAFAEALEQALAQTESLSAQERSARAGLANRQVTIR